MLNTDRLVQCEPRKSTIRQADESGECVNCPIKGCHFTAQKNQVGKIEVN